MNITKKPILLIVDDDTTNLRYLQEILGNDYALRLSDGGERALRYLERERPDLILLDAEMPGLNGYEVITRIKQMPTRKDIPIMFLTGHEDQDMELAAFRLGAVDYIQKPVSSGVVRSRVRLHIELEHYQRNLENLVEERTEQLKTTQDAILNILANMTSFRDNETGAHIKRTTFYVQSLTENLMRLEYPGYTMTDLYADSTIKCAKLHDIGKVAVPDNILLKPGKLTTLEYELIKQHSMYGAYILDTAIEDLGGTSYFLSVAREIIIGHHERWNGTGYPYGLAGDKIPLSARIMAIADVYDALISHRPYKVSFSHEVALGILHKDTGTSFDPTLMKLSANVLDDFRAIAAEHQDHDRASMFD